MSNKMPNKLPKLARYVSALLFCFIVVAVAAYASTGRTAPVWRADMYESETLNTRQQGLDIRGEIPVVLESFGTAHEFLNNEIDAAVDALIEGARRLRSRSVTFDFEIKNTNTVVSIVISATSRAVTERTAVRSVNFNNRGELVTPTTIIGHDIAPLAESKIADMIRQDPATYYAAFNAPPTGQAFYVTDTKLVLLFDEFQLSSVPGATSQIEFVRANIVSFTIQRSDYRISPDRYAIKMMPLRTTLEGLGFSVAWSSPEATISLNGQEIIVLRAGENNYQLSNGALQRSLEAPPTMFRNSMYVPLSFFDQILGLTSFRIDNRGNITFITYLGRG